MQLGKFLRGKKRRKFPTSIAFAASIVVMSLVATLFAAAQPATAEDVVGAWAQETLSSPATPYPAVAYDPASQTTVVFYGGSTWIWFGKRWTLVKPPVSPAGFAVAALDGATDQVLLVDQAGGTWSWEGLAKRWNRESPSTSPPARGSNRHMAYDPAAGRIILVDSGPSSFETWTWDGATRDWTRQNPPTSPPARVGTSLASDPVTQKVVLFGGSDGTQGLNDTWLWNGAESNWSKVEPMVSPPARSQHVMANHDALGGVLLFGGSADVYHTPFSDTWLWDGQQEIWKPQATGPAGRLGGGMAYDAARSRVMMFGGFLYADLPTLECISVWLFLFEPQVCVGPMTLSEGSTWTFGQKPTPLEAEPPGEVWGIYVATGDGVVRLTWYKPYDPRLCTLYLCPPEDRPPVTNYQIRKRVVCCGDPLTLVATIGPETYYDDRAVTNGNWYEYTISAINANGEGPQSDRIDARPSPDTTAPQTWIMRGPEGVTNNSYTALQFMSGEPASTFECALDGSAFSACGQTPGWSGSTSYSGLSDGTHTFYVRALDVSENADPTPASRSWTVDANPPDTVINRGPAGTVNSTTATFEFESNEAGGTFYCSMDAGDFNPCASPATYSGLSDGSHTFAVRATDVAGSIDQTPATLTWNIDTAVPASPSLISPANGSSSSNAKPLFDWTDVTDSSGVMYQIQIDNSGSTFPSPEINQSELSTSSFTPSSPLPIGTYSWRVRASDGAGNIAWSAVSTVTITTSPGAIAGKVTNQSKQGIAGATVNCGSAGSSTTASDGSYAITNVAPGSYTCTANASGFKSVSKSVTVHSATTTTASFALRKA